MEDWTEANLVKLSVKELKSFVRKRKLTVNPNSKKAELIKTLLTNNKDTSYVNETNEAQISRRMTRSRVSIWQTTDETSDYLKNPKEKINYLESKLNSDLKDSVHGKRIKKKRERVEENIDLYDTAEMFPLVSSIQSVSKPLLEITNKDIENNRVSEEGEFKTATTKSKPIKQKKLKNKNIEADIPCSNSGGGGASTNIQTSLPDESSEQTDCDLNSTFIVEGKGRNTSIQSDEKLIFNKSTNSNNEVVKVEDSKQHAKCSIKNELKSEKNKRGKKRKPDSPLGNEIPLENISIEHVSPETTDSVASNYVFHVQKKSSVKSKSNDFPSSTRQKRTSPVFEKSVQNESQNTSNFTKVKRKKSNKDINDSTNTITQNIENSDSGIAYNKIMSNSDETKLNDSKKRKRVNNLPQNISNNLDSSFEEVDLNKSKRKKSERDTKNMQKLLESEDSKNHEITESVETNNSSGSQRSSRRSRSIPKLETEYSVVNVNTNDLVFRNPTNKLKNSQENIVDDKNDLSIKGETGENSTQAPIRSSTFVLSDMAVKKNSPPIQCAPKHGKSIGSRMMQSSIIKRTDEKLTKKEPGSTLKKTITKVTTPGSIFKKKPASKMPNFKKIHQQLFNNMESLSENKKRQLDRAHGFLQSPIVPRCALLSPKPMNAANPVTSPLIKEHNTKVKSPMVPSPLATKLKTPAAKTPIASLKPVPGPSSVNRFGFRRQLKKEEAKNIIGKKLPSLNMENKKDQERKLLHGVRMNKRFMLQMQMRQNLKDSGK